MSQAFGSLKNETSISEIGRSSGFYRSIEESRTCAYYSKYGSVSPSNEAVRSTVYA